MPAKPKPAATAAPAPKQSRSYPSLEQWICHPERVANLKRIFADPDFVGACHYVEGVMEVTPDDLIGAKALPDDALKHKTAMAVGVRAFVATLAALPNFRKPQASEVLVPWGHIQAPIR